MYTAYIELFKNAQNYHYRLIESLKIHKLNIWVLIVMPVRSSSKDQECCRAFQNILGGSDWILSGGESGFYGFNLRNWGIPLAASFITKIPQSGNMQHPVCGTELYFFSLEEYVQRRVCFVNVQSSLHLNVVFFSLCAHGQCRVYYIYHVEFHFRFRSLVSFPV